MVWYKKGNEVVDDWHIMPDGSRRRVIKKYRPNKQQYYAWYYPVGQAVITIGKPIGFVGNYFLAYGGDVKKYQSDFTTTNQYAIDRSKIQNGIQVNISDKYYDYYEETDKNQSELLVQSGSLINYKGTTEFKFTTAQLDTGAQLAITDTNLGFAFAVTIRYSDGDIFIESTSEKIIQLTEIQTPCLVKLVVLMDRLTHLIITGNF